MAKELYVGHLPYEATENDLRQLFSVAGTVTSVHIITDPSSGKSKGCGYVRMSSEEELKEAITCLDGALVGAKIISVSIARPQKQQPAGKKQRAPRRTAASTADTKHSPGPPGSRGPRAVSGKTPPAAFSGRRTPRGRS